MTIGRKTKDASTLVTELFFGRYLVSKVIPNQKIKFYLKCLFKCEIEVLNKSIFIQLRYLLLIA